jgi:outer membrane receptor protein involved in Fe transport
MKQKMLATAVCAALLGSFASAAQAQDAAAPAQDTDKSDPTNLDKIIVTGSRIPQTELETATPVISITAQDIQRQGFKDVYDVLRAQPLSTGAVQDSQFTAGFTPGAEPISLLGLDPGFTLVLIDGRPMADYPLLYNGQSNFVDLSSIPTAMVERIDIAPGNQSAVYGSSAIAGVVNIILKKRIDGTVLNMRFGAYDEGGGGNSRFQLTGGKSVGGVDLVYGLQYSRQDPIYAFQRKDFDSTNDNPSASTRYGSRTFLRLDTNGAYVDPGEAACAPLAGLFGGTTIYDSRSYADGRPDGRYCGSRYEPGFTSIMNKEVSASGYLNASYHINDGAELYATALLNRTKSRINGGSRFWQPSIDTSGYIVNADIGDFESYQHIFSPEETGSLDYNDERQTSDSYNVAAGIRGTFGQSKWDYDAYYNRAQYEVDSRQNWPLKDKIEDFFRQQFLGPQLGTTSGYPIYSPNVANFYKALTPDQYRSFQDEIKSVSKTYTQNVNLALTNTELFNLPAGPVGFAGVLQYGEQYWENPTDQRVVNGLFWGLTGTQGEGKRKNQAVAVEFRVPIFEKLTANLSGRYDRYENEGLNSDKDLTYKAALEFRPVDSLLLRANYATAFKAPDMAYVFAGNSGFYTTVTDYYRCATEQAGVPLEDCDFNAEQVFGNRSGAPDLESITAKSWGVGAVWAPSADFNVSVDYYRIKIDNEVNDLNLDQLLQVESACRQGQLDINSPSCVDALSRIGRAGAGAPTPNQLNTVATNPINISKEEVSGITSKLDWQREFDNFGTLGFGVSYNVTLKHEKQQYPQDPTLDYLNEPFYSSEFRNIMNANVSWGRGPWNVTLYGVRYGSTPNYTAQINQAGYDAVGAKKVGALTRFNTSIAYEFTDDIQLSFTVNNLTDKNSPKDNTYTAYPYYNIFNYSGYGRSFLVELNWRFGASGQ